MTVLGGTTAASGPPLPRPEELAATFEAVKNWGRWGRDDELGTLRHLTPERVAAAATLATAGIAVSLAHDLAAGHGGHVAHEMLTCGDDLGATGIPGYEATRDRIGADVHSLDVTHLDALCHMFVDGRMYNGATAAAVTREGAERNSVMTAASGVVGRGVLLDVPAALGRAYLEPSHRITVDDLELAAARQGTEVGTGDLLVVSTGRDARAAALGGPLDPFEHGLAGIHPSCLPWLRERDIALLGSDGISDPMPPSTIERWPFPIHQVAITAIGLMLVDNLRLDDLVDRCTQLGRWEFLLLIAPLRIAGATGCPVNPIALL